MRRSRLRSTVAFVLVVSIACSSLLVAGEGMPKKLQPDSLGQHKEFLRPVPSRIEQALTEAALFQTAESAIQSVQQVQQQKAFHFALLQEFSSMTKRVNLAVLVWCAGWSLGWTILFFALAPMGRRNQILDPPSGTAEIHKNYKLNALLVGAGRYRAAGSSGAGTRGAGRPRPNLGTVAFTHTVLTTPGIRLGILGRSAAPKTIDLARRANRGQGEIELTLRLEKLQQEIENGHHTAIEQD